MNYQRTAVQSQSSSGVEKVFLSSWRPYCWIAFTGILLYCPAFFFNFTQFDDDFLILKNYDFLSKLQNIPVAFRQPVFDLYYRPFLTVSLILDAQLGHLSPFIYHLSNVLYHVIASMLLFGVLTSLLNSRSRGFFGSVLFTIHPLATQAVAWIPGRNESLLAIGIFSSFLFFLSFVETKKNITLACHLLLFFCALLTKETAVVFPFLCLSYCYIFTAAKFSWKELFPVAFSWLVVIIIWYEMRDAAINHAISSENLVSMQSFFGNIPIFLELAGKTFLPVRLSAYATVSTVSTVLGVAIILGVASWLVNRHENVNFRQVFFSLLWFALFLLPVLFVTPTTNLRRYDYLEHRAYLPLAGIIFMIASLVRTNEHRLKSKILFPVIAAACLLLSVIHQQHFRDPLALWTHAAETSPKAAHAFFHLGILYEDNSGDLARAEQAYTTAAELDPNNSEYRNNLGSVYAREGGQQRAKEEFQKATALDPGNQFACYNLGSICFIENNFYAAESLWKRTIAIDPKFSNAYEQLIQLYLNERQREDAEKIYRLAIRNEIPLEENLKRVFRITRP